LPVTASKDRFEGFEAFIVFAGIELATIAAALMSVKVSNVIPNTLVDQFMRKKGELSPEEALPGQFQWSLHI
jgi:hypothetical protein